MSAATRRGFALLEVSRGGSTPTYLSQLVAEISATAEPRNRSGCCVRKSHPTASTSECSRWAPAEAWHPNLSSNMQKWAQNHRLSHFFAALHWTWVPTVLSETSDHFTNYLFLLNNAILARDAGASGETTAYHIPWVTALQLPPLVSLSKNGNIFPTQSHLLSKWSGLLSTVLEGAHTSLP